MHTTDQISHPTLPIIVSADDHMEVCFLPADLWTSRLPRALRDIGPRVVNVGGGPEWRCEDAGWGPWGRSLPELSVRTDGFTPGDPNDRLRDMDHDGVFAQIIYAPFSGFPVTQTALRVHVLQAYNDWALEYSSNNRDRLVLLAQLPCHSPAAAVSELLRAANCGHRGMQLDLNDGADPVYEQAWETFWATANDVGVPISLHIFGGLHSLRAPTRDSWRRPALVSVLPLQLDEIMAGLVFSGILERYPKVRVVFGETGIGWLPYILGRFDHEYHRYRDRLRDYRLRQLPSELAARQVFFTWEEDAVGIELIDRLPLSNLMWASDYPHFDSTWPNSRAALATLIDRIGEAAVRRVASSNAAGLYGINL